jgi:hypothetical protein
MPTYYTFIGAFKPLRNQMNKEFKRVGITNIKEKRWFFQKVLGEVPYISEMTIAQLERVIEELQSLEDNHFAKDKSVSNV